MPLMMMAGPSYTVTLPPGGANTPEAANFTLEITYPKAVAAAPNGLDSGNRCYKAYTGLTYEIPLCAIGGSYPYSWSLSNAPAGMTVDSYTMASGMTGHKIVWVNPTSTASSIVVSVEDALENTDSETYSITVGTSGFYFVDPVGGSDVAAGTLAAPWATLDKVNDDTNPDDVVYFRTGTVTLAGIAITDNAGNVNGEARTDWEGSSQWLAYPGESPELDFEYAGNGAPYGDGDDKQRIRFASIHDNIFIDGLTISNPMVMAFQIGNSNGRGTGFWRNHFTGIGYAIDGGNSAYVMWSSKTTESYGDFQVSNTYDTATPGYAPGSGNVPPTALKLYDTLKPLLMGNLATTSESGDAVLALKAGVQQFSVIANKGVDIDDGLFIGGNLSASNIDASEICYGEIAYNLCLSDAADTAFGNGCLQIMDHSNAIGEVFVYRNTFRGTCSISDMKTGDGPVHYFKNVLINANGAQTPWNYFIDSDISDQTVVDIADNLTGNSGSGIIDSNGLLTGASRTTYLGTRGHEVP